MSDPVPLHLSIEGRAALIADAAGRLYAKPEDRRKAVEAEALSHLRVVRAQTVTELQRGL